MFAITHSFPGLELLKEKTLEALKHDWPQTLEDWDVLQAHTRHLSLILTQNPLGVISTITQSLPDLALAYQLSKKYNISAILPALFTMLAQIPSMCDEDFDQIFSDVNFDHQSRFSSRYRSVDWSLIDTVDVERIHQGQTLFRHRIRDIASSISYTDTNTILHHDHSECIHALTLLLTKDEIMEYYFHADLLGLWQLLIDRLKNAGSTLCAECSEQLYRHAATSRQDIWNLLPNIFNL
jgi:hypothetical protein